MYRIRQDDVRCGPLYLTLNWPMGTSYVWVSPGCPDRILRYENPDEARYAVDKYRTHTGAQHKVVIEGTAWDAVRDGFGL